MDLLSSLGLDALPEQSTRLTSHSGVRQALEKARAGADVRLGFNACLRCGSSLLEDDNGGEGSTKSPKKAVGVSRKVVVCKACTRVKYCSVACCKADAAGDLSREVAAGHSPVICALLNLCHDDDAAEEGVRERSPASPREEAACYRLRTERESYPATLFNVLAEGPDWFAAALARRQRDRGAPTQKRRDVTLHIVGASADAELWNWRGGTDEEVLRAYAEAAANLAGHLRDLPHVHQVAFVRCVFVGPDCPATPYRAEVPIPGVPSATLAFETHCVNYGEAGRPPLPPADAIVFFNPGFSCPDYDWSMALAAATAGRRVPMPRGPIPFLITTNTEMEGLADVKYLLDGGHIDANTVPAEILEAVDYSSCEEETSGDHADRDSQGKPFFFDPNPYAGLRVRQSGTMGNDLYVKNSYLVGGLFRNGGVGDCTNLSSQDQKHSDKRCKRCEGGSKGSSGEKQSRKRHPSNDGNKNTKRKNHALI